LGIEHFLSSLSGLQLNLSFLQITAIDLCFDRFIKLVSLRATKSISYRVSKKRIVPIPNTLPGELVDIVAELQAPYAATNIRATWKMIDSSGNLCFPDQYNFGLLMEITVIEPE
jgi:hypothetical protein